MVVSDEQSFASKDWAMAIGDQFGAFLSEPVTGKVKNTIMARDPEGNNNGIFALHDEGTASIPGNSGIPCHGPNGKLGFHYGKAATGEGAILCPTGPVPVTIKLQTKGPRDPMLAEQVRAMATPHINTLRGLTLKSKDKDHVQIWTKNLLTALGAVKSVERPWRVLSCSWLFDLQRVIGFLATRGQNLN